jgi:hypothetical protein
MCDDFIDNFEDGDFDGDDGFIDDDFDDDEADGDTTTETDDGLWNGPDWQDWMIIGPLSEDIAKEKRKQERDMFGDDYDSFSEDIPNLDNTKE